MKIDEKDINVLVSIGGEADIFVDKEFTLGSYRAVAANEPDFFDKMIYELVTKYKTQLEESEKFVTISQEEYKGLLEDGKLIGALFQAGVDNWEGYDHAQELMEEMDD